MNDIEAAYMRYDVMLRCAYPVSRWDKAEVCVLVAVLKCNCMCGGGRDTKSWYVCCLLTCNVCKASEILWTM